jgi:hypothetical protein
VIDARAHAGRLAIIAAIAAITACHAAPDPSATSPDDDAQLNAAAASLDNAANATEPTP